MKSLHDSTGTGLALLAFIQRRGGRVTVREVVRGIEAYRTAQEAEGRLRGLIGAGLGVWTYQPVGPMGGRPLRQFELSAPAEALARLWRLDQPSHQLSVGRERQLIRDLVELLDRYPGTPCDVLARALSRISQSLSRVAEYEATQALRRRRVQMSDGGGIEVCWE